MRPHILHGPIHALYQPALMVRGLRGIGVKADLMSWCNHFSEYSFKLDGEICLGDENDTLSRNRISFLVDAVERYDIFHFHSGYTLLPSFYNGADLRLLKKLGKIIVMSRWGCRDGSLPSVFNKRAGLCEICPINNICTDDFLRERLMREEEFVDLIINHEPDFAGYNHRAIFMHATIDINFWKPDLSPPSHIQKAFPRNKRIINIIHAVGGNNRGDVKGSSIIEKTIHDLKQKGLQINYLAIHGKSFKELRYYIIQADIVIDQLRYGSFGSFAREAMSLGKMVIGHVADDQRQVLGKNFPIVEANSDTLSVVIEKYIKKPSLIADIGKASRNYAEKELNHIKLAKKMSGIYHDLLNGKQIKQRRLHGF